MKNSTFASDIELELENNIIGCLLFDTEAIKTVINKGLESHHFRIESNRMIFNAAKSVYAKNHHGVDMMTVALQLEEDGNLNKVGGQFALVEMVSPIVSASNVDEYAKLLIGKSGKRVLASVAADIAKQCNDPTIRQNELVNTLKEKVSELESIAEDENKEDKNDLAVAIAEVKRILLDETLDDVQKEVRISQIKKEYKVDNDLWYRLTKSTRQEVEKFRLDLELKALLINNDPLEQLMNLSSIAQKYRIQISVLKEALKLMKVKTQTPEFEVESLDSLFNSGSQAIDYLVPGLLPRGESALLVAMPKVGKSLLGVDLAFSVATGESTFLGEVCQTGKVLLVSVDESRNSAGRKLMKRGFRTQDQDKIKVVTKFTIEQLDKLEETIEDFRPTLVIIDSLKRITKGLDIDENSAKFADNVYSISELCNKYNASCLLIHHSKKNNESTGVENSRGSTAITGALGNVWLLDRIGKQDSTNKKKVIFDPSDTKRRLYCYSRDSEGKAFDLELNPENNSWTLLGEVGMTQKEQQEQQTAKHRILSLLQVNQTHHPEGISGKDIHDCLDKVRPGEISKGYMYVVLNRLVDDKIITSKPAPGNKRYTLYSLPVDSESMTPNVSTESNQEKNLQSEGKSVIDNKPKIPPSPPPLYVSDDIQDAEINTEKEFPDTYHHTYHSDIISSNFEENQTIDITPIPDEQGISGSYLSSESKTGGGGVKPSDDSFLIDNEMAFQELILEVNSPEQKPEVPTHYSLLNPVKNNRDIAPIVGKTYLDADGYPHNITKKTDKAWLDQDEQQITPGLVRSPEYREWSAKEQTQLANDVLDAVKRLENGSQAMIAALVEDEVKMAQIKVIKYAIKKHLGSERWNLFVSWYRNR